MDVEGVQAHRRQHNESDRHVGLKRSAVRWLRGRGFGSDEIGLEVSQGTGFVDVYATRGSIEVAIECETDFSGTRSSIGAGAQEVFDRGGQLFILTDEWLYDVRTKLVEKTFRDLWGNTYKRRGHGRREHTEVYEFRRMAPYKEL